jgi:aldehyde:ferredoxin oxidoreductase
VGCKSPLTGGIKEANGGGQLQLRPRPAEDRRLHLLDASPDWVVIHFKKDGTIDFDDAAPYLGRGNFEARTCCTPSTARRSRSVSAVRSGEYQGLIAGIAFSDKDGRPPGSPRAGGWGR